MHKFKLFALATAFVVSGAGLAIAEQSSLDALSSASSVSFESFAGAGNILLTSGGRVDEQVDLDSLRARISQNPAVFAQFQAYGADLDDVIGITGSSETDVKIYLRG